ncbi:MAG: dTMP kinase, partial [Planctomycetota bacterium]
MDIERRAEPLAREASDEAPPRIADDPLAWPDPKAVRGKLIAVEGIDGSGKSTQVYLVKRWLESTGHRVFFTEWNSSDLVGEATRRGRKENLLTATTFCLIHATDFADRY